MFEMAVIQCHLTAQALRTGEHTWCEIGKYFIENEIADPGTRHAEGVWG